MNETQTTPISTLEIEYIPQPEVTEQVLKAGSALIDISQNRTESQQDATWEVVDGRSQLKEAGLSTTLPQEFFERDEDGALYMAADSLDILSDGSYTLSVSGSEAKIVITTIDGDKFVTSTSRRNDYNPFPDTEQTIEKRHLPSGFGAFSFAEGLAVQLSGNDAPNDVGVSTLESIGYKFDFENKNSRLIPTPETVRKIVDRFDLPIEVISESNDSGVISGRDYLGSFARGNYPVGSGDLAVYAHDVRSNDHMVGVVVLGREGLAKLAPIATAVLDKGNADELGETAVFFDNITSTVSNLLERPTTQAYIDIAGGDKELNWQKSAEEVAKVCLFIARMGESVGVQVDAQDMFDYLKARIEEMHSSFDYGEDYSQYIKVLKSQELPVVVAPAIQEEQLSSDIF